MIIPFFRTGTHTDSSGKTDTYSADELDRRIALYNEQHDHEAPVVIGHPANNGPAWAWVKRLFRRGEICYAEADQVDDGFASALRDGRFKKVSASWYGSGLLRHIGFLGATPPAVKGLPQFTFAEGDAQVVEFATDDFLSRWSWESLVRTLRRLRDYIIEKDGLDTADKVMNPWDLDALEPAPPPSDDNSFSQNKDNAMTPEIQAQLDAMKKENEQLKAQIEAGRAAHAKEEKDRARAAFTAFCESEEMRGRITPAFRPMVDAVYDLVGTDMHEFTEGEGDEAKTVKKSGQQILMELLRHVTPQVEFKEVAKDGVQPKTDGERDTEKILTAATSFTGR
jgi:hypothetical protein